ncbi:MAG: hypothetical protein HWD61_11580 [Parachlamydiaceae bacterium]|nr:MAG: hypothetical protein HWD61_11580 [Parachlamydiaceae bacterium]
MTTILILAYPATVQPAERILQSNSSNKSFEKKPKAAKATKTIVPENDQVSRFEVLWTLARIYSHNEESQGKALKLYDKLIREAPEKLTSTSNWHTFTQI